MALKDYPAKYLKYFGKVPIAFIRKMGSFPRIVYIDMDDHMGEYHDSGILYLRKDLSKPYSNSEAYTLLHELAHSFHITTRLITNLKASPIVKKAFTEVQKTWNNEYSDLKTIFNKTNTYRIPLYLEKNGYGKFPTDESLQEFLYFLSSIDPDVINKHYDKSLHEYYDDNTYRYQEFFTTSFTSFYLNSPYLNLVPEIKEHIELMFKNILKS